MSMDYSLSLQSLRSRYQSGALTPQQMICDVLDRIGKDEHHCWITRFDEEQLTKYTDALRGKDPAALPLYGIPFAIKDNIDLAGVPTTAACPEYTYVPEHSAYVVQRLLDAGAIPIGKTNMDQFATGLVGTRTPYGATLNPFNNEYIAGGSSSGSAVAVSLGQVSFALGTDTAGSGRVPAAFNNIIGMKPTRGVLSTQGVVPACRTLDCVSIFALGMDDLQTVYSITQDFNKNDPWAVKSKEGKNIASRQFRFGVPRTTELNFFGNKEYKRLYQEAITKCEQMGGERIEIDYQPFAVAAKLLYEGPWVAERYSVIKDLIKSKLHAIHPVIKSVIEPAAEMGTVDAFEKIYELKKIKHQTDMIMNELDFLLLPTTGTIYRLDEVIQNPVQLNSNLGNYTNFMNLLEYAGLALPAGFTVEGLPFGITLVANKFHDQQLLDYGKRYMQNYGNNIGATNFKSYICNTEKIQNADDAVINVVVCGAHMSGMALNSQLTDRDAKLVSKTRTAGKYRLFALAGGPPFRPGLLYDEKAGNRIEVEVWSLPKNKLADFVALIPPPLGLGRVELEDGSNESGFICEPRGFDGADEITQFGSWRSFIASKN